MGQQEEVLREEVCWVEGQQFVHKAFTEGVLYHNDEYAHDEAHAAGSTPFANVFGPEHH